ncbi:ABC transporter ATP-binding protein [Larsenimonas salina]|uniref:ABC transporter ATP-binding protein n=1 Tax=Larsenimonas salina TaxID=1295565 RepID=UPI002073F804|nr:dipeptide/oligopeptide/nickel ABC transporter ATP-binding protein [Larsenimonas salina]MCM5703064.1 dipeptide/oligopeptide/nickel ABC transporter ATP-binding protein [Larsenimonas salina]
MSGLNELNDDGSLLKIEALEKSVTLPGPFWTKKTRRRTLDSVSFSIFPGELIGLAGVSGAGKTTLLNMMLGLDRADAGRIVCEGQVITPGSVRALRWYRRAVQYIPQDPASSLDPRMTVRALIREPLKRLKIEADHTARVDEALEHVGLSPEFLDRRPDELSGGQAQRVAIARAIVVRPKLLLADEPLSGLDLPMQAHITDVLKRLNHEAGIGLLLISHDLSVVCRLCQRTIILDGGAIIEDRSTPELFDAPGHKRTIALIDAAAGYRSSAQ